MQATLEAAMPGLVRAAAVSGAALALIEDGAPRFAAGYRDVLADASAPPLTARTLFQAASVSKPVAAWTFLRLVEDGRLDLDTPIVDGLGDSRFPPSPWAPSGVMLRRVLSHTAGLSVPGYGGFALGMPRESLLESLGGATDAGGQALALTAAPGTRFSDSGGGYTLAELLLEQVTGEGFAEVARAGAAPPRDE
jgi:CubicO group peptidase (beta-lactamase class C family)